MSCTTSCTFCKRLIISQSVTVITVDGTDTLVIDLPTGSYMNGEKYCIVIAQAIPAGATVNMPVAFSIGGVTTTVYPFTRCDCAQATACAIRTRTRYSTRVITTATGGTFRSLGGLSCAPNNALASLPVPAVAAAPTVNTPVESATASTASITSDDLKALSDSKSVTKSVTTKTALKVG